MMTRYQARERVQELVEGGATATLDGKPAVIRGFLHEFAIVRDRDDHIRQAEWAWESALAILEKHGGNFTTK